MQRGPLGSQLYPVNKGNTNVTSSHRGMPVPSSRRGRKNTDVAGGWGCQHAMLWGMSLPLEMLFRASQRWECLDKFYCFLGHFHTDSAK